MFLVGWLTFPEPRGFLLFSTWFNKGRIVEAVSGVHAVDSQLRYFSSFIKKGYIFHCHLGPFPNVFLVGWLTFPEPRGFLLFSTWFNKGRIVEAVSGVHAVDSQLRYFSSFIEKGYIFTVT